MILKEKNERTSLLRSIKGLIQIRGLNISDVLFRNNVLIFRGHFTKITATCPYCHKRSKQVRSKYIRTLLNLPILQFASKLILSVRRFKCSNKKCKRKIFSERFEELTVPYSRVTTQAYKRLQDLFVEVSARKGAYISTIMGVSRSPSTCLRYVHKLQVPTHFELAHIGIDDWALRKGCTYGSIIVDSKTGRPIDLINSRNKTEVSAYLKRFESLKTVTRDRASSYAKAIKESHPDAHQIADKFHLVKNLGEALYKEIRLRHKEVMNTAKVKESIKEAERAIKEIGFSTKEKEIASILEYNAPDTTGIVSLERLELHKKVHELHKTGMSAKGIARFLEIDRSKVRRLLKKNKLIGKQKSFANDYTSYMNIIIICCKNRMTVISIYNYLCTIGFKGGQTSFYNWFNQSFPSYIELIKKKKSNKVSYDKLKELKITVKKQYVSARKLAIYISSDIYGIDKKTGEIFGEHIAANELIKQSPILSKLKLIFRQFKEIMAGDDVELLQNWIDVLNKTEFKNLRQFLRGVQIDQKAIFNAIRYKYTNGLVEGNVNRLKNKKREMYGRAGFELLRRKVCLSQTG